MKGLNFMAEIFERSDKRTHYCGQLSESDIGKRVSVLGWTQRQRDLGGLIFIDLRDRTGIVQLAFDDDTDRAIFEKAFGIRAEYVLGAEGVVRARSSVNPNIPTGMIEIAVDKLKIFSVAQTPPFEVGTGKKVGDDVALRHRYLDLRRPELQNNIRIRHEIARVAREYYYENGFYEIETPMLIKPTPEGARDYVVPSRIHPGCMYALPQSPQIYKQLLMLSGFDRYIQIARCFRDEDLRADRQPEFTQIDLEMSFVTQEDIMEMNEGFIKRCFKEVLNIDIETPMRRMTFAEAMDNYGSDKPDTRYDMIIKDLSETLIAKKEALRSVDTPVEESLIGKLSDLLSKTYSATLALEKAEAVARSKENDEQRAMAYKENVLPKMEALRRAVDSMEVLTAREYWPVPTYGDLTYRV